VIRFGRIIYNVVQENKNTGRYSQYESLDNTKVIFSNSLNIEKILKEIIRKAESNRKI